MNDPIRLDGQEWFDDRRDVLKDCTGCIFVILFAVAAIVIGFFLYAGLSGVAGIDERTEALCREYADRDHEKEIAPSRYQWLGKDFVDSFDWYGSCIDHIKQPVAGVDDAF